MGIGFYFPDYASPTKEWVPSRAPALPVIEKVDYPEQLTGSTAGGILYVQKKGQRRVLHDLRFVELSADDKDAAMEFFDTVCKAERSFHYRDLLGNLHNVRWANEFQLQMEAGGRYSGLIRLREE